MKKTATLILTLLLTTNCTSPSPNNPQSPRNPLDSTTHINPSSRAKLQNLSVCVKRVMIRAAEKRLALFWQPQFLEQIILMRSLLKDLPYDVWLHNFELPTDRVFGRSSIVGIVIFVHDLEYLGALARIINHGNVDKKGKIVVCLTLESWKEEVLVSIADFLWEHKVANGILMASDEKNTVQLYSYWPMTAVHCKPIDVWCLVCDCNNIDFALENIFTRKMMDMNNCPIKVSAITLGAAVTVYEENSVYKIKGYEANLLHAISVAMNFKPVILPPPRQLWGDVQPNGTWTGIHGDLQSGAADLGICMIYPLFKRLHFEDYSQPFSFDRYIWIVPEASPVNGNNLWLPRRALIWMVVSLAVLLVVACLIGEAYLFNRPFLKSTCFIWRILVGDKSFWDNTQSGSKILMLAWLFFSFIFMNLHLSDLFSSLTANVQPNNFETTKDLLKNNVPFGGQNTLGQFFANDDPEDEAVYTKYRIIDNSKLLDKLFSVVIEKVRFAFISQDVVALPLKNDFDFHVMDEIVMTYPSVFALPKSSPYIEEFNRKILFLNEAGLSEYWKRCNGTKFIKRKSSPKPLKVFNLLSVFLIWLMCIGFAIVTFFCETFIGKKYRKLHK